MNIIYMGTPDFAVPTLETLINSEHTVSLVVTQPDKAKGRSKRLVPSPVKEVAIRENIPVYQPDKIREGGADYLSKFKPDIIVVAAFGQILSKDILDLPKYGCINVHASLLPAWRGAAPIQWSIINGDSETGITIMQMNEGLDTGDIILKEVYKMTGKETGGSLFDTLSGMGGEATLKALELIEKGQAERIPQAESTTSYASMLKKEMGELNFNKTGAEIERLVRALYPWPGTYTYLDDKILKVHEVKLTSDVEERFVNEAIAASEKKKIGEYVSTAGEYIWVKTSDGIIALSKVQIAGKKSMSSEEFLRGHRLEF